ncbi:uncharacterized protein LOC125377549 [Haliotis rufescens]|uniref:uncharacterized protein LOC125377549 n=1 Tax=Haliotis rufescens TaxID=6454 RepID=UPI001EAFCF09|nr:uncharacterized protein LOC125377549 [Haliotis rufescens]
MSDSSATFSEDGQRCQLALGNNVFVVAKFWHGKMKIHIREYTQERGRWFPMKRGITLTLQRWMELVSNKARIEETMESGGLLKCHLGGNMYAEMDNTYPGLDIRKWYWCGKQNVVKPYKRPGIKLDVDQMKQLLNCFIVMPDFVSELLNVVPCYMQKDHMNQFGYFMCPECNPNGLSVWGPTPV